MVGQRDTGRWQKRLEELARDAGIPGASLAVLVDGEVHTAVTGVLNIETGVEVTPDTLFQVGSTTKTFTTTAFMRLVESGRAALDRPVVDVLPEFKTVDPDTTQRVTPRHLLTHTSGIAGDLILDTGSGSDALERFLERLADAPLDLPLGVLHSYSNAGFVVLGRMIERITGQIWDAALHELVLDPLGLDHTATLPDELVRFRATCGHAGGPGDIRLESRQPVGTSLRSGAPAGSMMYASATDVVNHGRLYLDEGVARDGMRLLQAETTREMLRPQVPALSLTNDHCGLCWMIFDWGGRKVVEHGGGTPGHLAFFEMVPDHGVAIALLLNGRNSFADALYRELFQELCDLDRPAPPKPEPAVSADSALDADLVGRYERCGVQVDVEQRDGALHATERIIEPLASLFPGMPAVDWELQPSSAGDSVYLSREAATGDDAGQGEAGDPLFFPMIDGRRYLYMGGRGHTRVG